MSIYKDYEQECIDTLPTDTSWATPQLATTWFTIPARGAEFIRHYTPFATDEAGRLFYYYQGCYRINGENVFKKIYAKFQQIFMLDAQWRSRQRDEALKFVIDTSPKLLPVPDMDRINLQNGVYNWQTKVFTPHPNPDYYTNVQIPINYDPTILGSIEWDKFLTDVCPGGVEVLYKIIGICLIPYTKLQKCFVLLGSGRNGKGVFLRGLTAVIGTNNISSMTLQRLSNDDDKFATGSLVGKLVNICGDLPDSKVKDAGRYKGLTGEDLLTIEYKNKQPFNYRPFCRYIFSSYAVIDFNDKSEGCKSRTIYIPFTRKFSESPKIGQILEDSLSDPFELSGLLNTVLELLPGVVSNGLDLTEDQLMLIATYSPIPEDVEFWITDNIEEDPEGSIPKAALHKYIEKLGICKSREFFGHMKTKFNLTKEMEDRVTYTSADYGETFQVRSYVGIRIKNNDLERELRLSALRSHRKDALEALQQ